ncbi:MAG TPA: universal stress protein [Bryobacteraceae bacterium]|nr:universal stress protein [Bryobacteraceae bacterium]
MKLLLAIDSSVGSEAASDAVTSRLWPAGTSIEVVHVMDNSHLLDSALMDEQTRDEMQRRSQEMVERVAQRVHGKPVLLSGDPKAAITDYAKETGADFVVVGPHQQSGLGRFLLGSVAKAIVRYAPCSVEVVRGHPPIEPPRRILLATDGFEMSNLAAQSIAERPWPEGTEVRILSAVELAMTTFQAALEPPFVNDAAMEALREESMKRAQNAVASAEETIVGAGLKASESISVSVDSPKQIIIDEAKAWGADLIVVGSHGRRGISRFVLGSVSEAVATHAECSVEVIRKRP